MQIGTACPHESHDNSDIDERYVEWKPCYLHVPSAAGSEDALISVFAGELAFTGTEESSAQTNRAYATWMRKNRARKARRKK